MQIELDEIEEEIKDLVIDIELLKEKRNTIDSLLMIKLEKLNGLRKFDDIWVWCSTCNHRHKHWSDIVWNHKSYIKKIPKRCLFKTDHCWKHIGNKYGKRDEIGIPNISIEECIVCKEKKAVVYAWTDETKEDRLARRILKMLSDIMNLRLVKYTQY